MGQAHPAEPIVVDGLGGVLHGGRIAYDVTGDAEYDDKQGVEPVEESHRYLPYVYFYEIASATFHKMKFSGVGSMGGLLAVDIHAVDYSAVLIIEVYGARHTGVEGVERAHDAQSHFGTVGGHALYGGTDDRGLEG